MTNEINDFLSETGINEVTLAGMTGMSQASINMIKNGRYKPQPVKVEHFFKSEVARQLVATHQELKRLSVHKMPQVTGSMVLYRAGLHKRISELLNKKAPIVSTRPAPQS